MVDSPYQLVSRISAINSYDTSDGMHILSPCLAIFHPSPQLVSNMAPSAQCQATASSSKHLPPGGSTSWFLDWCTVLPCLCQCVNIIILKQPYISLLLRCLVLATWQPEKTWLCRYHLQKSTAPESLIHQLNMILWWSDLIVKHLYYCRIWI